jgi:protein-L-isoaspartate(D-aspartate) O-methyltransferase
MYDFAVSRQHMVDGQIRTNDVTDLRIIRAFKSVPREAFIPKAKQAVAYSDVNINVDGRTVMRPRDFGKMLQGLDINPSDVALDIGCARGYSSAILAQLCETVVSLEVSDEMVERATAELVKADVMNVAVVKGDLKAGAREHGPFDIIFVNGAVSEVPQSWFDQLAMGGRLAVVLLNGPIGQAVIFTRGKDAIGKTVICDASLPLIDGFKREVAFQL